MNSRFMAALTDKELREYVRKKFISQFKDEQIGAVAGYLGVSGVKYEFKQQKKKAIHGKEESEPDIVIHFQSTGESKTHWVIEFANSTGGFSLPFYLRRFSEEDIFMTSTHFDIKMNAIIYDKAESQQHSVIAFLNYIVMDLYTQ